MATAYTIYSLAVNGEVFYVGITKLPLRVRLEGHKNKLGFTPSIEIIDELETSQESEARFFESYWICQFRSWGFRLQNKKQTSDNYQPLRRINVLQRSIHSPAHHAFINKKDN